MGKIHTEASAVIAAPPAAIYAVLADYRHRHPHILPKQYFPELSVEAGGQGAGTIIRVRTRVLGIEREYHMLVSEPEPGRILVETDQATGLATTFTVTPTEDGAGSRVQIATAWDAPAGVAGLIERFITPPIMRHIYRTELRQLATYMAATIQPD